MGAVVNSATGNKAAARYEAAPIGSGKSEEDGSETSSYFSRET